MQALTQPYTPDFLTCLQQMLVAEHNGVVPQTFQELEKLPGVGHKTASVVICTAFG